METIRKYSYVNFKHFSKDGIKIRTSSPVSCIRYTNITDKTKRLIETRITNENIDVNIVGVAFNPSNKIIDFLYNSTLNNIRKENSNGFDDFIKHIDIINHKNNKIYYWLFDNNKDKPKTDTYINYNINDVHNNIKLMINEIYNYYIKLIKNKFNKYIDHINKNIDNNNNFTLSKLNSFLYK